MLLLQLIMVPKWSSLTYSIIVFDYLKKFFWVNVQKKILTVKQKNKMLIFILYYCYRKQIIGIMKIKFLILTVRELDKDNNQQL